MRKATLVSIISLLAVSSQAFAQAAGGTGMGDKGLYALGLGLMLGLGRLWRDHGPEPRWCGRDGRSSS